MSELAQAACLTGIDRVSLFAVLAVKDAQFIRFAAALAPLLLTILVLAGAVLFRAACGLGAAFTSGFGHIRGTSCAEKKSQRRAS